MSNHKYIYRKPDGIGGWKYFYKNTLNVKMANQSDEFVKIYNNYQHELPFSIRSGDIEKTSNISIKKCVDFENKFLKNIKIERCGAFDQKGNLLFQKEGTENLIELTREEMKIINGCEIFTHNHTEEMSFSLEDIICCVVLGIKEIRVVSPNKIYSLKMSYNRVPKNVNQINDFLKYIKAKFLKTEKDAVNQLQSLVDFNMINELKNSVVIKTLQEDVKFREYFNIEYEVKKNEK